MIWCSGPNRAQNPVEWEDFLSIGQFVHPSICLSICLYHCRSFGPRASQPCLRASQACFPAIQSGLRAIQPGLRASQTGLRASLTARPQNQPVSQPGLRVGQPAKTQS